MTLQTIGSSKDKEEIEMFMHKAQQVILNFQSQCSLDFHKKEELEFVDSFVNSIDSFKLVGPELLLGKIFDDIGFNAISDKLFRHLVITRLIYPVSKLKTVDYLYKYMGVETSVYSIYRYLDKLHKNQISQIQDISLNHTLKLFDNKLSVVFYDVTTLYFEASDEDDLRKTGFSKDGKHQCPQILLGLLVSEGGYPLDYEIFDGDTFEGDTMFVVIDHFIHKHKPEQLIIVADSGLLSAKNIIAIEEKKYHYILGARIKNESKKMQETILSAILKDGESTRIVRENGSFLILSYKENRAKKDKYNRDKGLEKLKKKIKSGKLTKSNINNKGYNKYLDRKSVV